jgi:hypothetical protein
MDNNFRTVKPHSLNRSKKEDQDLMEELSGDDAPYRDVLSKFDQLRKSLSQARADEGLLRKLDELRDVFIKRHEADKRAAQKT